MNFYFKNILGYAVCWLLAIATAMVCCLVLLFLIEIFNLPDMLALSLIAPFFFICYKAYLVLRWRGFRDQFFRIPKVIRTYNCPRPKVYDCLHHSIYHLPSEFRGYTLGDWLDNQREKEYEKESYDPDETSFQRILSRLGI